MFRKHYGVEIVTGEFGSGKTFNTNSMLPVSDHVLNVTNYVSQASDIQFRSLSDLIFVLDRIYQWKLDERNRKVMVNIVIDEGFLYFDSRHFKTFPEEIKPFLVQVRKMNVRISILVQNPNQIDVNFRRLAGYVREYRNFYLFFFSRVYKLLDERGSLKDENNAEPVGFSFHLPPFLSLFWARTTAVLRIFVRRNFPKLSKWVDAPNLALYDTREMILPHFSIIDKHRIRQMLPVHFTIRDASEYSGYVGSQTEKIMAGKPKEYAKKWTWHDDGKIDSPPDLEKKKLTVSA